MIVPRYTTGNISSTGLIGLTKVWSWDNGKTWVVIPNQPGITKAESLSKHKTIDETNE